MQASPPITDTAALAARCDALKHCAFITVDTEFIRERTYYPRLCLLQIAGEDGAAFAVDPLASGLDMAPVIALFDNPAITKVFHAARQDLEIFYHLSGKLPRPIFDTQIAAQFAGLGEAISYGDLIRRLLNVSLDKGARFTDWSRRPLTDRQILYALDDVIHLAEAYVKLKDQLEKAGRLSWVAEEMSRLNDPGIYVIDPKNAWERIKFGNMKPRPLALLQSLAEWREQEAVRLDIPRGHVLKDETLVEIAALMPQSMNELTHLRGMRQLSAKRTELILEKAMAVQAIPQESLPRLERKRAAESNPDTVQLLQLLLGFQCRRHNILPRLVATRDELEALAAGNPPSSLTHDWRHDIFGAAAAKLLAGEMTLSIDPETGNVRIQG